MPQHNGEHEAALRELYSQISELHPGLHTIQILTVDPDDRSTFREEDGSPRLTYLLLSSRAAEYRDAVLEFTNHKREGLAYRTLAFDDCREPLGRWIELQSRPYARQCPETELIFSKVEFGQVQPQNPDETLEARLDYWRHSLDREFHDGGCSCWLTIRHRALKGVGEPIVSSLFLVFKAVVAEEARPPIVHLVREFLFDRVLHFYEREIDKQHEDIEQAIRNYFFKTSDLLLAPSTVDEVSRLKPLLAAGIPILIEGERGTGKLNLALRLLAARREVDGLARPDATPAAAPIVVNCAYLSEDRAAAIEWFRKKGLLSDQDELNDALRQDVIFDDVHLCSRSAQQFIYRLVSSRLGWDAGEPVPDTVRMDRPCVILTVGSSLHAAIAKGSVIRELGLLGAFKVSLPTLHDRLGQIPPENRLAEFAKIVGYLGHRAMGVIPNRPRFQIADEQLSRWMNLAWEENYWGLKQMILYHVINSNELATSGE